MKILVIDDDKDILYLIKSQLAKSGHEVFVLEDSTIALEKMDLYKPDVIVVDLLMPKIDGYTLIKNIRKNAEYSPIKIIVISAKGFEPDRERAYEMGANAYLVKPIGYEELVENIENVLNDEMKLSFWGTRGTIPVPSKDFLRFGGNTSCVSVEMTKDRLIVFDAGTGIIELGKYLNEQKKNCKINVLISHSHWDHIQGLPFFMPAYKQGNEIAVYGSPQGNLSLREVISGQMESTYFPITIREFAARIYFQEIAEGDFTIDGLSCSAIMLNHPGIALGYRLTSPKGKSIAYITDNEIDRRGAERQDTHARQKLVKFLNKVDVLIHDTTFLDDEYKSKAGWGHPPLTEVLKLAAEAEVKTLFLSHHDPDHDDDKVAEKEAIALRYCEEHKLDMKCSAAVEGSSFSF